MAVDYAEDGGNGPTMDDDDVFALKEVAQRSLNDVASGQPAPNANVGDESGDDNGIALDDIDGLGLDEDIGRAQHAAALTP